MTDRTKSWAEMAAECAIDAASATDHDDAMELIGLSVANALLAIHDTLAAADRYAANEARQREGQLEDAWRSRDWETVRRLQDEAKQREAEPDPLDENDHRDRIDGNGRRVRRKSIGGWAWAGFEEVGGWTLNDIHRYQGPLTFAPDAAQDATGGDLSASESESGDEEGEGADVAELTTTATGDTWHEAAQAAVNEAAGLLGEVDVLRVDIEAIIAARRFCDPEPQVAGYRATVTIRPKGVGHD